MSSSLGAATYYAVAEPDGKAVFDTYIADSSLTSLKVNLRSRTENADGMITFKLCKDQGCGDVVWSRAIPYHVRNYALDGSAIKLATYEGANTTTVRQINPGAAASDFRVTASTNGTGNWLSAKIDANGALAVNVNGSGMTLGNYSGTIEVKSAVDGYLNTSLRIPVSISLGAGFALPANRNITLAAASPSVINDAIALGFNGSQSPTWSATSDKPWLTLQAASGTGPAKVAYSIDTNKLSDLQNYATATANVTFKSAGMRDAVHKVIVQRTLPQITALTPNPVLAGRVTELHLRGRGFAQLSGISAFKIANVPATGGSIVSDTEAIVTVSLPNAGRYALSLPASSGPVIAQPTLNVANPAEMPAALIDSAGDKSALLYSASRNALYMIDKTNGKLLRYRLSGSTWINDKSLPVDSRGGIGLSLDDQILYTTSLDSTVEERDPETLDVKASYKDDRFAPEIRPYYSMGLPITNDGRIWFSRKESSELRYFDTISKKFSNAEREDRFVFNTPIYTVSRDGSRMFVALQPTNNGTYDALRYDSATGQFDKVANMSYSASMGMALSGDGKYVATDAGKVHESASYRLIGSLPNGTGGYPNSTLLSPDGSRIYAAAYGLVSVSGSIIHTLVRLDVIDTNSMSKIGEIALPPGAASCGSDIIACNITGLFTMSPFGETIFWAGYSKIAVIPVPKAFRSAASATRFQLRK